tara:strand:+ start:262 stop:624 length:363 start_codon:yes stop_codon:yes gene_type:complete
MAFVQKNGVITEVSDDQFPARPEPTIEEQRADMSLTRRAFCLVLVGEDILPPAEAIEAAKGNWPATFDAALGDMSDADKVDAQIEWATAQNVQRKHPLIAMLATAASLTDTQVDALFGHS